MAPRLNRALLQAPGFAQRIEARLIDLPEKAVQFGIGAFLRGFVEYFIDAANRAGVFNGRVVAIGSTDSGRDRRLSEQDGLYTLAVQGIERGQERKEFRLITALSRALSARAVDAVLECARNPGSS
jgi:tagaturonate reductase